jgi:type VI secretion system secreted protein Hcp
VLLVVVAMLALVAADATAGGFVKYEGIDGESQDKDHEGWNDLIAWSWGMERVSGAGGGQGRNSSRAKFEGLSFTKEMDSTTPVMMRFFAEGSRLRQVTLDLPNHGEREGRIRMILSNVRVTSVHVGEKGESGVHFENVTLNFGEVKVIYEGMGRTVEFGWNIQSGSAL